MPTQESAYEALVTAADSRATSGDDRAVGPIAQLINTGMKIQAKQ